ncbi:MAG TPA: tryptophan synthase subunit alpha [Steroidobacter sp.]|jgi:tryptophan synthase alpha chain|nr:tryptophan synthase subunit alpha [Steroidobacter sp.]
MTPPDTITEAIRGAKSQGRPALVAYITAGFPTQAGFLEQLQAVAGVADVVEIGVPFTDPMADGTTIQHSSRVALTQGVSLKWILAQLSAPRPACRAPLLLMSYLNPLLAYGLDQLPAHAAKAGVAGFIVPDLPLEECAELREALAAQGVALVQFVTPVTPIERMQKLCAASRGFIYAVTMTGTTGKNVAVPQEALDYFARVKSLSPVPVCAGFGIRSRDQIERLAPYVDGVIVGSALIEVLGRGEDPAAFLRSLRSVSAQPTTLGLTCKN